MTLLKRLRATRAIIMLAVFVGALMWGLSITLLMLGTAATVDIISGFPRAARHMALPLAIVTGILVGAGVAWRGRNARRMSAVALWIEERLPSLRYALVTWAEAHRESGMGNRESEQRRRLEKVVASVSWKRPVARAVTRTVVIPAAVLILASVWLLSLPQGAVARVRVPRAGDSIERPVRSVAGRINRLVPLVATVVPPAYTGETRRVLDDPVSVSGLTGSAVTLEGRGAADGISARSGAGNLQVISNGERWRTSFAMPAAATALVLADGAFERLLALDPRPDSVPVVLLVAPARDTVLRTPSGLLALMAEAADDFGLTSIWFEYIVSSGEGENFSFRSGIVRREAIRGSRAKSHRAALRLDSLALAPGDVVHLRAAARDANPARGRGQGTGFSETRTIRVARASEYDSIAVEGASPPEADKSEVSQRMLIILTEALQKKRPRLARPAVVSESRRISVDQTRLRRRVAEIIFTRLGEDNSAEDEEVPGEVPAGGVLTPEELLRAAEEATDRSGAEAIDFSEGESPVVAINRPLLEAYNAMWGANRELDSGEPGRALPHMRAALAAIQRARQAERIYLRGRAPTVIVDLARVRMTGSRDGLAPRMPRTPRTATERIRFERERRFGIAVRLLEDSLMHAAAIDSLLLLRIDAAGDTPALAAAIGKVIEILRSGHSATSALAAARRTLAGEPASSSNIAQWGGAW
ncbi:MAG: hypothetical protein ABR543_02035 [Gemmatimonadaceae bacterium]